MNTWFTHLKTFHAFDAALEQKLLNSNEPPEESMQWHSGYEYLENA